MSENIPIEIQTEILKRVPVKSLFQFRSISKSWKSLIDSSQFIADYDEYQSRPQRLLISYEDHLHPDYRSEFDTKYVIIVDDDMFPQHKLATTFPMSFSEYLEIIPVSSSQGLLCFLGGYEDYESYKERAFIWNPAIRKSIAIDVPVSDEMLPIILGFGVCPNINEPMLVIITDSDEILYRRVELFTLSSRVWRRLLCNLPRKSIAFTELQVAIDGVIYWQTYDGLIVSFDMRSEEFTEINLPKTLASTINLSISNLRGSLAVLEHGKEDEKSLCDVWMMEHGVPKSFTKLFTVTTPNACLMKVLGFRMNGEPILEVNKTDDYKEPAVLEVYDPHTGHVKDLGIYAKLESLSVMSYVETLLLLDQVDNQHIEFELQSL